MQLKRRLLLSCAALLALGGCLCNQDLCVVTGVTPVTVSFGTTWQPVTFTALLPVKCGERMATSVVVSVLDPSNNPVSHTKTDPRTTDQGFEVDVTFTPTVPGTHHIAARFEPNFGTAQAGVVVAAERRDAGSVLVPGRCDRGDFTPSGLVLCTNDSAVDVLDAGLRFTGVTARWGPVLWVYDGGSVARLVDDGGAFELTAVATTSNTYRSIIPGRDDAVFLFGTGRDLWTDAGIFGASGPLGVGADALWRSGQDIAFIRGMRDWCTGRIPDYVPDGGRCTPLTSPTAVGFGPEGIWVQNESTAMTGATSLEVMLLDARNQLGFPLPAGWTVLAPGARNPLQLLWDTGALLDGGLPDGGPFVLGRSGDNILLENYGPRVSAITSTCVTVPEGSSTRLYRR